MIAEAAMGLSSLKTAFDIAKGLKDIDNAANRNAAVIELQEKILSAQLSQASLIEKIGDLEKHVASLETWNAERQRYELKDLPKGFFAYILKEGKEDGEPPHAICTNCYQKGFKSILHLNNTSDMRDRTWDCPSCKTKIRNQQSEIGGLIKKSREPST